MSKTVKQLIETLQKFDPDLPVYFDYDDGYQQYEIENVYHSEYRNYPNSPVDCVMIETEFTSPNWEVKNDPANEITCIDISEYLNPNKIQN